MELIVVFYSYPKITVNKFEKSEAGPPLFEIPATIEAAAHRPIRAAAMLKAVTATLDISKLVSDFVSA